MEQKGQDDFLRALREEEPDAAASLPVPKPGPEIQAWCGTAWRAWHGLRFDRSYGMGGESPISFQAIDAWAKRYRVEAEAFEMLHRLIVAMDDEYLTWRSEKREEERRLHGNQNQN